jgi:hypothetical protein
MWWQWFQPERDRIAAEIAKSAAWNEGYRVGYGVAAAQRRCDKCSDSVDAVDVKIDKQP